MNIEELVNSAYTTWAHGKGTSWTGHMRAALTEQAETHAIELRAYEATVQNLEQRIRELEHELQNKQFDALRKDAERYRWLRDDAFKHSDDCFMEAGRLFAGHHGDSFDVAVDAAIAQEQTKMIKVGDMVVFTESELNTQLCLGYTTNNPGLLALLNKQPVEVTAIYANKSAYIGLSREGTLLALPLKGLRIADAAIAQGKGE